jgi:hypothetical protein
VSGKANEGPPAALEVGPEEFLSGWEPSTSRLFLAGLVRAPLGARVAVRVTIRGTGIGATVVGPVIAVRHVAGAALPSGSYLEFPGRTAGAAHYLARVARGLPVEFNERDPRYAVSWGVTLEGDPGQFPALTENVSSEGCSLSWRGLALAVGCRVTIRRRRLLAPALPAQVCWTATDGELAAAGLHLEVAGRAVQSWRSALAREVRLGAGML